MSAHKGERVLFNVRLPVETWRALKHAAVDRRTSMNDEVNLAVERRLAELRPGPEQKNR